MQAACSALPPGELVRSPVCVSFRGTNETGFYLITTDVLGPYTVGYAMGTLGWAPGTVLYTVFAALTAYSGYLVWRVFVGVDSYEFPARNYGDLAFRIWGRVGRHITNIIQSISLILLAGQVTLQAGQNLSQTSRFRLCYVVCPIIYIVVGFTLSQIRTLKNYGLVANMSVYLNLLAIFITMGFVSHSPPNYQIATLGSSGSTADPTTITPVNGKYPAVMHYNGLPPNGLVGSLNGLMNCVLGYAGVQLYVEFMAEMRRPMDFIKAVWSATAFVYTVYLVYGCFVYYYQGQYTFNPSYMGVSVYGWQTAANMITLVALFISGGLYSNIGIKVVYNNVCVDILRAPPLSSWLGKRLYAGLVGLWWIVAFIIACAIPDFEGIVSIFSAATLVNLTYSVPAIIALGYDIQRNALRPERGEGFDPTTGQVVHDGSLLARWARGFVSGGPVQVCLNLWHSVYFLGALSLCGLGMYASIERECCVY